MYSAPASSPPTSQHALRLGAATTTPPPLVLTQRLGARATPPAPVATAPRPARRLAAALGAVALVGLAAAMWVRPTPLERAAASAPVPLTPRVSSPRAQCEGRMLLALQRCLKRVCDQPALREHRDCRRVRPFASHAR